MAFDVDFYIFAKEVNSSERPPVANKLTQSCKANGRINIVNPTISLQLGQGGVNSPAVYNYCYIQNFGRYYFIENWEWAGGLWTAYCSVDVLATYRNRIYDMTGYVVRSAHSYDGTISDALYLGRELFQQYSLTYPAPWSNSIYSGRVIVGVAGTGSSRYYRFTWTNFKRFIANMLSNQYVTDVVQNEWQLDAMSEAKSIVDPLQYITSVVYIPLNIGSTTGTMSVPLGFGHVGQYIHGQDWECSEIPLGNSSVTEETVMITNIPVHPMSNDRGEYLNHAPWTSYSLDVAPFGSIELDPSSFRGAIKLVYHIDWLTGSVILRIWGQKWEDNQWKNLIEMNVLKGQLGVNIEVGQVVAKGMGWLDHVQHGANLISQVMGGITGGGGTGAMSENQLGGVLDMAGSSLAGSIVGGAASLTSGAIGWMRDSMLSKIPHLNSVGSTGSFVEYTTPIILSVKCIYPMHENREQRGRPLCKTMRLGDLAADSISTDQQYHSGYMMIADPDVKNIAATAAERSMIVAFMTGGFFLA